MFQNKWRCGSYEVYAYSLFKTRGFLGVYVHHDPKSSWDFILMEYMIFSVRPQSRPTIHMISQVSLTNIAHSQSHPDMHCQLESGKVFQLEG